LNTGTFDRVADDVCAASLKGHRHAHRHHLGLSAVERARSADLADGGVGTDSHDIGNVLFLFQPTATGFEFP